MTPIRNRTHDPVDLQVHLFLTSALWSVLRPSRLTLGESDPATYWEESGWAPEFFSNLSRREKFFPCLGMEV
jgi:hypothetical protein